MTTKIEGNDMRQKNTRIHALVTLMRWTALCLMGLTIHGNLVQAAAKPAGVIASNAVVARPQSATPIVGLQKLVTNLFTASGHFRPFAGPGSHVFSGTVTDKNSVPIPNVTVNVLDNNGQIVQSVQTDSSGSFSMTLLADTYTYVTFSTGYHATYGGYNLTAMNLGNPGDVTLNLTNGDVTQNFVLNFVNLKVVTSDGNGNPVSGTHAYYAFYTPGGYTSVSANGNTYSFAINAVSRDGLTDANGAWSVLLPQGATFAPSSPQHGDQMLCADYADNTHLCNGFSISTAANINVLFQEAEGVVSTPIQPANAGTTSPVQNPEVSWSAVAGATSYDVYRNGSEIGTATSTSYLDSTAPEGAEVYDVTAVNAAGEGAASNTASTFVDRTAPTIIYTVSPMANAAGWNNADVTVRFICYDNAGGSGIASCTAPTTLNTDGANQTLSGTAVDNAGNTASLTTGAINIDKTPPTASAATMSNAVVVLQANETITATATDALSGVTGGEYYIDTDPGQGNGQPMTYANGQVSASTTINTSMSVGLHTLFVRTKDAAGNWSATTSKTFTYL